MSCFPDSGARNIPQHVLCLHQGPQVKETGGLHHGDPRHLHIHHTDFLVVFTLLFKHVYKLYARYGKAHFQALLSQQEKRGGSRLVSHWMWWKRVIVLLNIHQHQ